MSENQYNSYGQTWYVWDNASSKKNYKSVAHQIADGLMKPEDRFKQWEGIEWLPGEEGWTVLDVGCGNGNYCPFFTDGMGMEYTGCDLSVNMLSICRENYPDSEFVRGDATALPFEDNEFDMVFCSDVLLNTPREVQEAIVTELIRVAKRVAVVHQRVLYEGPRVQQEWDDGTIFRYEVLDDEIEWMEQIDPEVEWYKRNERNVVGEGADVFFIFRKDEEFETEELPGW
jgi:ubiquinone/menaquinone biosynthesis C-methylase UbiE